MDTNSRSMEITPFARNWRNFKNDYAVIHHANGGFQITREIDGVRYTSNHNGCGKSITYKEGDRAKLQQIYHYKEMIIK
jgi:hypothetical protein